MCESRSSISNLILDHNAGVAQRGLEPCDLVAGFGDAVVDAGRRVVGAKVGPLAQVDRQRAPVGG
ncbi:MAG: hypothetical protein ACJ8CR_35125 [Roseiflexaceae bacterium]